MKIEFNKWYLSHSTYFYDMAFDITISKHSARTYLGISIQPGRPGWPGAVFLYEYTKDDFKGHKVATPNEVKMMWEKLSKNQAGLRGIFWNIFS